MMDTTEISFIFINQSFRIHLAQSKVKKLKMRKSWN